MYLKQAMDKIKFKTLAMSSYSLLNLRICGYYRSAVYLVSTNEERISNSVAESSSVGKHYNVFCFEQMYLFK